ncbi:ribosome silencing factor [Calditrichota bacterium]
MESKELSKTITNLALEKKGKQIAVLDLQGLTSMTDYFIIITGDSDTHIKAIADHIIRQLKKKKTKIYHKEGLGSLRWVLLDYVDVIVHIFRGETREFYGLERLWADAKIEFVIE